MSNSVTLFQESCGSENGLLGSRPRRGDVQYQGNGGGGGGYQQYSSQDSLPDSPYSSQSLDSHAGQTTGSDDQTFFIGDDGDLLCLWTT